MMGVAMSSLALGVILVVRQYEAVLANFRRESKRAQEAAEAKSTCLATMSHELRSPLTGV